MEEKKEVSNVTETAKKGFGKAKNFCTDTFTKLKEDKAFLKKVICYAVAVVVVIIAIVLLAGNMGPKGMAKRYMRAYSKLDDKAIIKMMYKEEADDYEDVLEERFEALEDEDFKVKEWEIKSVKKLEGKKLETIQDAYDDEYEVKVTKVVRVKVKVKTKIDDDTNTATRELYFGKIKGKWCLLGGM